MKKNNLLITILVLIVCLGSASVFLYLQYKQSPKYSLNMIAQSFNTHDYALFKKHVDMEGVSSEMVDDIMGFALDNTEEPENEWEKLGQEMAKGFLGLLKPRLTKTIQDQIQDYIETGKFEHSENNMVPLKKMFGVETTQSTSGNKNPTLGLKYIKKDGKIASVGLEVKGHVEDNYIIELKMRDLGSYWQVAEISNMDELISKFQLNIDSLASEGLGGNESMKNKAILGTAKANLDILRSCLAMFAVNQPDNRYPYTKEMPTYKKALEILKCDALPETMEIARWDIDYGFQYISDGIDFQTRVKAITGETLMGTPQGIN